MDATRVELCFPPPAPPSSRWKPLTSTDSTLSLAFIPPHLPPTLPSSFPISAQSTPVCCHTLPPPHSLSVSSHPPPLLPLLAVSPLCLPVNPHPRLQPRR